LQKRVKFKEHLAIFLIINIIIWILNIWINFSANLHSYWAAILTIGWGIGLSLHFTKTYFYDEDAAIKKEYKKLKTK